MNKWYKRGESLICPTRSCCPLEDWFCWILLKEKRILCTTQERAVSSQHHSCLSYSHLNISRQLEGRDLQKGAEMAIPYPVPCSNWHDPWSLTWQALHWLAGWVCPPHPASLQLIMNCCFASSGMALAHRFQPQLLPRTIVLSRYQRNLNL